MLCRSTALATDAFLDAFQRVADVANNSRGTLSNIYLSFSLLIENFLSLNSRTIVTTNCAFKIALSTEYSYFDCLNSERGIKQSISNETNRFSRGILYKFSVEKKLLFSLLSAIYSQSFIYSNYASFHYNIYKSSRINIRFETSFTLTRSA